MKFDSPKSISLILKSVSSNIFSGFRSRWAIPSLCIYSTAFIIWINMRPPALSPNLYWSAISLNNYPCSTYSVIRYIWSSDSITSYNWTILGCRNILIIYTYRATLSSSSLSLMEDLSIILIATFYPLRVCLAALTFPKVPLPRVSSI